MVVVVEFFLLTFLFSTSGSFIFLIPFLLFLCGLKVIWKAFILYVYFLCLSFNYCLHVFLSYEVVIIFTLSSAAVHVL